MKHRRAVRRAIWITPPLGAIALLLVPQGDAELHSSAARRAAAVAEGVVLTAGQEPVVQYVPGDVTATRARARHQLPGPNASAARPVTQPVDVAPPMPVQVHGRARSELSQAHAPHLTGPHQATLPADETAHAAQPVAVSETVAAPAEATVQEAPSEQPVAVAAAAPVAQAVPSDESAAGVPRPAAPEAADEPVARVASRAAVRHLAARPLASAPAIPSPSAAAPVAQPVDVAPTAEGSDAVAAPSLAAPVQQPAVPVPSAPLAATPASAAPVVSAVTGLPEPAATQQPETTVDERETGAAGSARTEESAAPQADPRWARMEHVPHNPAAPVAGYPQAESDAPLPGLSAAVGSVPSRPAFQAPKGFGQLVVPAKVATPQSLMRSRDLEMIARNADGHTMIGFDLAGRRAYMSARDEFLRALRMVAEALDIHQQTDRHGKALAAGMRALEEADDFLPSGRGFEADIDVRTMVQGHTSPVIALDEAHGLAPYEARQRYYAYAQEQLAVAGGGETSSSMALHGLGKLYAALAHAPDSKLNEAEPKALALQQAALLVDGRNALAANELGVLLARAGRFEQAREVLLHSARLLPQPTTWHNLAVVHFQLGEQDLGQLAQLEADTALQQQRQLAAQRGLSLDPQVQWVSPTDFARTSETNLGAPTGPTPATPTATANSQARPAGNTGPANRR